MTQPIGAPDGRRHPWRPWRWDGRPPAERAADGTEPAPEGERTPDGAQGNSGPPDEAAVRAVLDVLAWPDDRESGAGSLWMIGEVIVERVAAVITRDAEATYRAGMNAGRLACEAEHGDIRAAEEIATALTGEAVQYPPDLFPADSPTREAIAGTAMRHAYRTAAVIALRIGGTS